MKIYLVRHGLTNTNKEKRYVGWGDAQLSSQGYLQAERLGLRFASEPVAGLYCSDLSRTLETAAPMARIHGLEPVKSRLLREINFGEWEGLTYQEMSPEQRDALWQWYDAPFLFAPPGGETLAQVLDRAWSFLLPLVEAERDGEAHVVVSHGGVIRSLVHRIKKLGLEQFWELSVENASVSLLQRSGRDMNIPYYNDRSHLADDYSAAGDPAADAWK